MKPGLGGQHDGSAKKYRYFDFIMAIFITVLLVSNVASSAKIVDLGFSLLGVSCFRSAISSATS